ncbi:hypothetical protein [Roseimicrobium sp. ORNL1]|uniref:hypothetical protein n=1 Tax=Roseimicrobium sp. ORNL1 TaxID=2711231 RepID=UPI0013E1A6A9|nr:hypothetical protein [Roseimicrobium sp. ORNL1]QIF00890.1 hypothetical protein G5S37_04925 [Roseimicrobium sp. ORNL1]
MKILASALDHLIADAREAYRVYELMSIRRPGDVWKYLWVEVIEGPDRVQYKDLVPLVDFDRRFMWAMDDTEPEDACWLEAREGAEFFNEMWRLYAQVQAAQAEVRASADPLIAIQMESIKIGRHPLDSKAETTVLRTRPEYVTPTLPKRSDAYYQKLKEMLSRTDVRSVVTRGSDYDYQTHRMLCTEQRRRAKELNCAPYEAFPIDIWFHSFDPSVGWGASFVRHFEGMGYGDLWLELDVDDDGFVKFLVEEEQHHHKFILMVNKGEDLEEYTCTAGDGWVLFEDQTEERQFRKWGEEMIRRQG